MGKISLIIGREFYQRVRKRSFILSTILTPLLMVGLMVAPILMSTIDNAPTKQIVVLDKSSQIMPLLESNDKVIFSIAEGDEQEFISSQVEGKDGCLIIGEDILTNPSSVRLYAYGSTTMGLEMEISSQMERIIEKKRLENYDIENLNQIISEISADVIIGVIKVDEQGEQQADSSIVSMASAYIFSFMIYMFVLIYGAMVLQGVIEEKNSKVLEVMVSSVSPFELMMGKILGIASVAITQFIIWVFFIMVSMGVLMQFLPPEMVAGGAEMASSSMVSGDDLKMVEALSSVINIWFLLRVFGGFLIYFIGGYLLYAACFAAIGSAVDNIQDSQQLQMPVTMPLILAIIVMMSVMQEPNGNLAFWFSMIPFTSPVIMMARLPYGVPTWELILSIVLLYASFMAMVWLAGKIYRVGIFMYGKRPTFKELYKWIKYK